MEKELKTDFNKMKIIMLIICFIIFLFFLSQVNISWHMKLQPIDENATPFESIIVWIFMGCIFGMIYYAYLCLTSMIVWKIINRKNKEANQSYTTVTKSGNRYVHHKPSKYDEQIEVLWFRFLNYVCIIEVAIVVFMYMFGIIKLL